MQLAAAVDSTEAAPENDPAVTADPDETEATSDVIIKSFTLIFQVTQSHILATVSVPNPDSCPRKPETAVISGFYVDSCMQLSVFIPNLDLKWNRSDKWEPIRELYRVQWINIVKFTVARSTMKPKSADKQLQYTRKVEVPNNNDIEGLWLE